MHRWRVLIVTMVVATVTAAGVMYAQGLRPGGRERGPGGPGMGGGPGVGMPLRGLDLTDAQRDQIRAVTRQHVEQTRGLRERLRAAIDAERAAAQAIPVDEGQIRAATEQRAAAEAEIAVEQARLRTEIFSLLTPEQQAKVKTFEAERKSRMAERRQRMEERRQQRQQPQ